MSSPIYQFAADTSSPSWADVSKESYDEYVSRGTWLTRIVYAAPAVERQEPVGDWAIDHSAGRPILVFKGCSVIEAEDADYVIRLIAGDREQPAPVAVVLPDPCVNKLVSTHYRNGWNACLDKVKELIPTTAAASNNLRNFANAMIDIALDGGNADGPQIQELAVEHGLLKPEQRSERCGDACSCAEYADFPVECFRKVKELNQ